MPPIDPTLNTREWATIKRVVPRDIYEEVVRFEELVAEHSGLPARFQGIGPCVSVWSILCHCLREHEAELMILAQEWNDKDSGASQQHDPSE